MATISDNLQAVRARIERAARGAGRDPDSVALLAVSKTHPAGAVEEAFAAGQPAFGENYVQEALDKMAALGRLQIDWHMIGPLQSNKTRRVAERFGWVHTLDRGKIARRLSQQRPAGLLPLNVLIQVNVSGESSKSGVSPVDAIALAQVVARLPGLRLRGLMAIPEPGGEMVLQRARFGAVHQLFQTLRAGGLPLDTLSMGMSDDLEAAIAEGATLVRVGSAIFGQRQRVRDAA